VSTSSMDSVWRFVDGRGLLPSPCSAALGTAVPYSVPGRGQTRGAWEWE
jgi:hypothetical protein